LFEVFRALVRSVEWSGVSGLILLALYQVPHSVIILSSAHRAQTTDVHYRVLVQWTALFAMASESPEHHACSISCLEIP